MIKRVVFLGLLPTAVARRPRFQLTGVGYDGQVFGGLGRRVTQCSVQLQAMS